MKPLKAIFGHSPATGPARAGASQMSAWMRLPRAEIFAVAKVRAVRTRAFDKAAVADRPCIASIHARPERAQGFGSKGRFQLHVQHILDAQQAARCAGAM